MIEALVGPNFWYTSDMSDDTLLSDEALAVLLAEADSRRRIAADEARLTPEERDIRRRFAEALWGKENAELYCSAITFTDPTTLIVMAEAYRQEAHLIGLKKRKEDKDIIARHRMASMVLIGIWMALRHETFFDHFKTGIAFPGYLPPVPKNWKKHRTGVYEAMDLDMPPDRTVVPFKRPLPTPP